MKVTIRQALRSLVLILFLANYATAQVNLTLGLQAYYPFTGNANDQSGNNNNPVFNNATLTADRFGSPNSAYHFNGIDNYIQVPNNPSLNFGNQVSLVAWVKPMGFYYGLCHGNSVIMKGDDGDYPGRYLIRFEDGQYLSSNNCSVPIPDTVHENYWGTGAFQNGGYSPVVTKGQWVCVTYTYDGTNAKIYLNCELVMNKVSPGYTFTNPYDLFIGKANANMVAFPYWFNGDLDDMRVYNRALNKDEVDSLAGCHPVDSVIINDYTPALAFDPCENKLTVENAGAFNPGDTVLLIQMKGAAIDSSNTASFGNITDYKSAGNYEFNYVKAKTGNVVELKNRLTRSYEIPNGKVQLIRVPYYANYSNTDVLTCLPWDGNKGGVVVLNVQNNIDLQADIDVGKKGFKGALGYNPQNTLTNCFQNDYNYPVARINDAGRKGESIVSISDNIICGKGSPASGGGGGLGHNSGGGGGSNGSTGGFGGYQLEPCGNAPYDNRGIGGHALTYSSAINKIFMGGGGGAGHADNFGNLPSDGGNGGGIVIIRCNDLKSNSFAIRANGMDGKACTIPESADCHEGMGGGGAGGTILIELNTIADNALTQQNGGKGADMIGSIALGNRIGAGGGGSGGVLFINKPTLPGSITNISNGGVNGVLTLDANNPFGATPGQNGITLFNLSVPIDNILFTPNIDSVKILDSATNCTAFLFEALDYTNTYPVNNWSWDFGDGNSAAGQMTNHDYAVGGTFPVKLVITDADGCKDSTTADVTTYPIQLDAGPVDTICIGSSSILQATNAGGIDFAWTPAAFLDDPTILNPTATPTTTTTFHVLTMNSPVCKVEDSVVIYVRDPKTFSVSPPSAICEGDTVMLNADGGDLYSWTPGNSTIPNPLVSPSISTDYSVLITDMVCNVSNTLLTTVIVHPLPQIQANKSGDIDCTKPESQLSVTGAQQYTWQPAASLAGPNTANPRASPAITTIYTVKGTDANGCSNYDSVTVAVGFAGSGNYLMPTAFTPNNDGLNDCYGLKYWGPITEVEFSIYNRWGERIFLTKDPSKCWNGTYQGMPAPAGVYVYVVRAKTLCTPSVFRKGTFALIR